MGMTAVVAALAGATLAGGLIQAKGQRDAGDYQQQINEHDAQVAEVNAQFAEENADIARETAEENALFYEESAVFAEYGADVSMARAESARARGAVAEFRHRLQTRQLMGRQRAVLAAQGQDVSADSALDVLVDTAVLSEMDALTIRNNASLEAWGFEVEAFDADVEAYNRRVAAYNARVTGKAQQRDFLQQGLNYRSQASGQVMAGGLAAASGRNQALGTVLTSGANAFAIGRSAYGSTAPTTTNPGATYPRPYTSSSYRMGTLAYPGGY